MNTGARDTCPGRHCSAATRCDIESPCGLLAVADAARRGKGAAEGIPGNPAGTGVTPLADTPTLEVLNELLAPSASGAKAAAPSHAEGDAPTELFA